MNYLTDREITIANEAYTNRLDNDIKSIVEGQSDLVKRRESINRQVGIDFRAYRIDHKVTQTELATALGCSQVAIVKMEQGKVSWDADRLTEMLGMVEALHQPSSDAL